MNKIFKVVWSKTKECYVVVSEVAKNNGGKKKVLASVLAGLAMVGAGALGTPVQAGTELGNGAVNIAPNNLVGQNYANTVTSNSVVVGYMNNSSGGPGNESGKIIYGANNQATRESSLAVGNQNKATNKSASAIGVGNTASGEASVAMGNSSTASGDRSIAIGSGANATQGAALAIGRQAEATGSSAVAVGYTNKAKKNVAVALGVNNNVDGEFSTAVGSSNTIATDANEATVIGRTNQVNRAGSFAGGFSNVTNGERNVAIGSENSTTGEDSIGIGKKTIAGTGKSIAIGTVYNPDDGSAAKQTIARGNDTINPATGQVNNVFALAIGNGAQADGKAKSASGMIAIGQDVLADNNNTIAVGVKTQATGNNSTAVGGYSKAIGISSAAFGTQAVANGLGATAFGPGASAGTGDTDGEAEGAVAIGRKATVAKAASGAAAIGWASEATKADATAIGHSATANIAGGVALGSESKTTVAAGVQGYNPASDRTNKYSTQAGAVGTSTLAAVSIGEDSTKTRQLTGLAAGTADTDAVNVAQLKNVNLKYAGDTGNSDVLLKDGTLNVKGDTNLISTSADATGIKVTAKVGDNITTNADGKAVAPTTNGIATTDNVTQAINNSGWKVTSANNGGTTNGSSSEKVSPGDTVTFSAGKNIVLDQAGKQFTYSLNKEVDLTKDGSLTIGDTKINNAGMTITGGPSVTKTGIDAGSKKITNVTAGTADTDAVNVSQIKGLRTEVKAGNGIEVNKTQGTDGHDIYTVSTKATGATASTWNIKSSATDGVNKGITTATNISDTKTVEMQAGKNLTVKQAATADGASVEFALNKDVDLTKDGSLTIGDTKVNNDGVTITGGPSVKKDGINAGDKKITNVEKGVADTDAVNVKQLKDAKTKLVDGENTTVEGDGTTATPYKVNVKGDLADISSITNGTGSGKISFEGDQVVKVGGDHPISFDGKGGYVTGLENKTWDLKNPTVVSGRAATEDQLKAVSDGFNNTVKLTGNTGATGTQKLNQDNGLSFGVVGADNGKYIKTSASGSDVVADLSDDAKAKLEHKVVVEAGSKNVTVATDTTDPSKTVYKVSVANTTAGAASTESVVKKADAAGDTNIADITVGNGKNSGDPDAQYEVNVSRNAVKDAAREAVTVNNGGNTNSPITVTPTDDAANHNTSYAVTFDGNKAAKVIPLTYKANGANDQTVTLEKGLNFTNGSNTTASVDADGVVKYDLNKDVDLTKNGSLTIGDTKVNNDGITITAPAGGTTTDVKLTNTGLDNGGNKITNVAEGTNNTDAVNVKQLKENRTEVKAGDNVVVTSAVDATDNHTVYTVNAVTPAVYTTPDGEKLTKDKDGKFHKVGETAEYTGDIITSFENPKAAAGQTTKDGGMIVNNVGSAIKNQTGATYLDKLKAAADDNSNVKNAVVNVSDLKNTSDALIDKGLRFDANEGGEQTNKLGSKVTVQGTGALSTGKAYADEYNTANIRTNIEQGTDGNTTINVGLAKALKGINSISNGGSSITISDVPAGATTPAVTISGGNLSMGDGTANNKIVNLAPGTDGTDAVNLNQLKGMRTVVTSTDKSVTVTPNENTATGQVTYDLKVATTGTVSKSTWDLKSGVASATEGTHSGDTTQTIADTKSVTMQAGKNLTVKQTNDGNGNTSVAYSLDKDLTNLDKVVVNGKDGIAGKDGVTIVGPQGATGAPGIPGTNGIDGKVGISGKDGKDAVSIAGKDGVGTIGLTGPQGPAGTNGKSVDISTENGTKTLVKPEANNNDQSQRIVYVPKDANGNPLKDADNNDIKREVATMDDGLKFAGDDGQTNTNKVIAKQLNQQVDIIGGATGTLTDNNIGVNNDGGKLKVQLAKDVDLTNAGSLTVGGTKVNNDGITIKAPTTPGTTTTDVKLTNTGLDNGGNTITNVAEGQNNTDAVNVKQLKENRTEVKAGDNVVVTSAVDATDNHTVYTVNAVTPAVYTTPDGEKLTKDKDGKFHKVGETAEYTGDIITSFENPKAAAGQTTKDGGMIVNNIGSAIKNQTGADYLAKLDTANGATPNAAVNVSDLKNTADALKSNELHIRPTASNRTGETVNKNAAGTADEVYKYDTATKSVTLKYNDGTGAGVTGTEAKIDLSDLANQITSGYTFKANATANGGTVANDAATPATATAVENGGTINYAAGKNLTVKQDIDVANKTHTYTYSLDKDLTNLDKVVVNGKDGVAGKDGVTIVGPQGATGAAGIPGTNGIDGKVGISGKDGKDAVSIAGKDGVGTIGLTGPQGPAGTNGKSVDISTENGTKTLVKPEANNNDQSQRIVYVPKDANGNPLKDADNNDIKREVATMDDGLKFAGDDGQTNTNKVIAKQLNQQVDIIGGATGTLTDNNIGVNNDGGKLKVQLAKDVDLTNAGSLTVGGTKVNNGGVTITAPAGGTTTDVKLTNTGLDNGGNKITNVAEGTNNTDAVNVKQLKANRTEVKAGDNVVVTTDVDATDNHTVYTVNAITPAVYTKADGTKVVKRPDGTFTTNVDGAPGNDVPASDVIVSFQDAAGNRTGGNSIVNNVGSAIDKPGTATGNTFLTKLDNAATDTPFAAVNVRDLKSTADALKASELHIAPTSVAAGSTEVVGGTASGNTNPGAATQAYKYNATTKQVELTFNDGNGKAVNGPKAVIDFSDLNIPAGGNNYGFKANATANGGTVANDATTPAAATAVESGGTVNFAAGKNLTVKQDIDATNKTQTYTFSLDKDLTNLDKVVVNGKDGIAGKDGVTIVGPQGATGAPGIPGTNGIDGKVGISGKDGKDAVSIAGKDGVGTIGLTGPQGPAGTNGKSVDISTENGKQTLVKPEANNGNQSQRIVYVPKDANGNPLKDADGNDIKREVATMDDGLRFTGNNTSKENKQPMNSLVKVQGEGVTENTAGKLEANGQEFKSAAGNIAVEADGDNTLTVKMNKDLNLTKDGSVTMGDTVVNNNGITIKAPTPAPGATPTTDVKLTNQGLDNGGNKITNVAAGTANTDAVNVKQLKDNVTTVESSNNSIKVVDKNVPGSATYDATKGHQYDITINNQSVVENAQTPVVYTNKDGDKLYRIVDPASGNVTFNTQPDGTGTTVQPADVIASMNNGGNSTTTPMKLNNVGSSIANETGATFLDKLDSANTNTPNGAVNVSDLKSTSDALIDKGLVFDANNADPKTNKLGSKVTIAGTGALGTGENFADKYNTDNIRTNIEQDGTGNTTVKIGLNKNLKGLESVSVPGKDGVDGKDGVSITGKDGANGVDGKVSIGKDGKDAVSISGKDGIGHIGLTGPAGKDGKNATADITVKEGQPGLNGTDGITRIVYKDKDGNDHEVATHDDGVKYAGDDAQGTDKTKVISKKLNETIDIVGGADKTKLTDNNIGVNNDGGKLKVQLANELAGINKISNGGSSITFNSNPGGATNTPAVQISGGDLNMGGNKITNLKKGTDASDAATVGQLTKVKSSNNTVGITESTDANGAKVYDLSVTGVPGADPRVDELGEEVGRVGAQGAALAALKPIQYDPLEPTQIMAGYGNYRGNSAIAMGVAHYKNESTLMHAGVSWAGGSRHMMANAGVTWKVGNRDSEAAVADRYRKGPISSAYAMQQEMASVKAQNAGLKTEVSDLKAENEQMKAQIAAMMAKLGM